MLDWTVVDDAEEPEPQPAQSPSPKPPPKRAPRIWPALFVLLILISGASIWWTTQDQNQQRRTRAARAVADQPLPAPLPGLVALEQPLVESATDLPGGALEVTAVHSYTGVDGTQLSFRATRIIEPDGTLQPSRLISATLEGSILRILYDVNDVELVKDDLAPYLEKVLADACNQWECQPDVHLTLDLTGDSPALASSRDAAQLIPVNRVFAYAGSFVVMSETLRVPRPSSYGTPVDDNTRSYWRRAIADAALVQLALQVRGQPDQGFFAPSLTHNAFFYALVLRQAARSGVEDEQWLTLMMPPEPGQTMAELWAQQTRMDHEPVAVQAELRAALGFLNPLIGQDDQLERVLFRNLEPDTGLDVWLARSFAGAGRSALDTLYNLTGDSTKRLLDDLARPDAEWFAIGSCAEGQFIWTPIGGELRLGLSSAVPGPARIVGARTTPAGLDLVVALGDQIALRSAATGRLAWAAGAGAGASAFAGWMGSLAAMYRFDNGQLAQDIVLVRPDTPTDIVATLSDVAAIVPAPGSELGVTLGPSVMDGSDPSAGQHALRAILPTTGLDVALGTGFAPAWGPDGQSLAVILGPGAETGWGGPFSVGIIPDVTQPGYARVIWSPDAGRDASGAGGTGLIAWEPAGSRVAALIGLRASTSGALELSSWIVDATSLQSAENARVELDIPDQVDAVTELDYSNDGKYLSATFWWLGRPEVRWYDSETGELVQQASYISQVAWSPTGHQAILLSPSGAALATEPNTTARPLPGVGCKEVLWNPAAPP